MTGPVNPALYTEVQEKKLLIKQMQPPTFRGEGTGLEKAAESWIEQMDDYFTAAGTVATNKAMLGMFKLTGEAKLWWKQNCKDRGVTKISQTWEDIKTAVKERYLPPGHEAIKMNEFYGLTQKNSTLGEYFTKFVSLRRYAPLMTLEQQIARFCQGLNSPLNTRLEAMRPSTLHDALLRAEPLAREIDQERGQRRREPATQRADNPNYQRSNPPNCFQPRPRFYTANGQNRSLANVRCYGCNELGHYQIDCPNRRNQVACTYGNDNPQAGRRQGHPNGN